MGSPDCNVSMVDIRLRKLLWVYCPGRARMKENDRADRLAGKTTLTSSLLLGRSDVLRSLKHYLRAAHHRSPGGKRCGIIEHRLAGKAALTSSLILGRSEMLRSLRHYLRAQSQGDHTIDRLEERGVERGSARRSSLKGRERAIVNQTKIGLLGKLLRDGIWDFPSAQIPS